jgi:DNA primase large subunit
MTLTKDVLVKIIKEELANLTAETETEETEVDPVDQEIAELEQQLAEAKMKKKNGKTGGMKVMGDSNTYKSAKSAMKPLKARAKK